jgi:hypothetical protein
MLQQTLWLADTIYITTDMQHLLMQAAHDLPQDIRFDIHSLLTPRGFCMFEETIYGEDVAGKKIAMSGIAWNEVLISETPYHLPIPDDETPDKAVLIYFFTPTDDMADDINRDMLPELRAAGWLIGPYAISHFYPIGDGAKIPEGSLPGAQLVTGLLRVFIAMQLLAQQKIGAPITMAPDRASRKRYARKYDGAPDRMITLITLRRKNVKKDDEESAKVEWQRRWVVRGHWRKQWYPSLKRHDWKYIYEYIKGPEDKPLVQTERRVFNFRR